MNKYFDTENLTFLTLVLLGLLFLMMAALVYVVVLQALRLRELRHENDSLHRRLQHQEEGALGLLGEQNVNFYDKGGRLSLSTKLSNVLFIESADNYANIHYINDGKEDTFILHSSLKDIERDYADLGLLRCHRGYMVNAHNVKLMRKDKTGLLLELNQSARTLPVSKSYSSSVARFFSGSISKSDS